MKIRKKYSYIVLYSFIVYLILFIFLANQLEHVSNILELPNFPEVAVSTKQPQGYALSIETELARRKLSRDEQELWNFLAAQLQLHWGHLIDKLPTTNDVITSILEYKSVLFEDVDLYKSQLESETSVTATTLLRILTHINTSLTQLFNNTLFELKRIRNSKRLLASKLSMATKTNLRFQHIKIYALLRQLMATTDHESSWYSQSRELGDKIQKQIQLLQNPRDCSSARTLLCGVCSELKDCGFACLAHHIGLCLVTAYLSNRTMILDCSGWRYSSQGWGVAFLPLTNCTAEHIQEKYIPEFMASHQVLEVFNQTLPKTIRMKLPIRIPGTTIFPPAVPRDIFNKYTNLLDLPRPKSTRYGTNSFRFQAAKLWNSLPEEARRITDFNSFKSFIKGWSGTQCGCALCRVLQFNSYPPSWWMGQFKIWAMRLKDEVARDVNKHFQRLNVTGTVVGLHVRRTDKSKEAGHRSLDEYMVYVAEWYDAYELTHPNVERRVYLATDESTLIKEAMLRYPRYEFIHDRQISSSAAVKSRYNEQSLRGTLKDINSLVRCEFVVCTFSSTMCRLVYELSQTNYGDTHSFQSLDDTYFVAGQPLGHGRATRDHIPLRQKEIGVKQGDAVQFLGNHWDGYALAVGMKKKKSGLLPAFKIDRIYIMYNWSSKIKT